MLEFLDLLANLERNNLLIVLCMCIIVQEYVQQQVTTEENAKRRMLLRYVQAVTAHATQQVEVNGQAHHAVLQLPESQISDEEAHALVALLRNNVHIQEVNLRGNAITDDGARALAAMLSKNAGLRQLDLRGNQVSKSAIKVLAEALERNERVRHVYVHAGGKVEALGTGVWNPNDTTSATGSDAAVAAPMVTVETVCVVDVRDNQVPDAGTNNDLLAHNYSSTYDFSTTKGPAMSQESTSMGAFSVGANGTMSTSLPTFNPTQLASTSADSAARGPSRKGKKKRSPGKKKPQAGHKTSERRQDPADTRRSKEQLKMEALEGAWQGRQAGLELSSQGGRKALPPLQDLEVQEQTYI